MSSCAASCCTCSPKVSCASGTSAPSGNDASPLWLCPKCGGTMMVVERLTAAEIQLRSPPVSLSTTIIVPPHLGQSQRGLASLPDGAEVPDAHETFGEQVQQEAAQELIERKGHKLLFIVVGEIAQTKRNLPITKGDKPTVADRTAIGLSAQ